MKDKANFKVEEDVSALRKAIEGLGKLTIHQYLTSTISDRHAKHFTQIRQNVLLHLLEEQV